MLTYSSDQRKSHSSEVHRPTREWLMLATQPSTQPLYIKGRKMRGVGPEGLMSTSVVAVTVAV